MAAVSYYSSLEPQGYASQSYVPYSPQYSPGFSTTRPGHLSHDSTGTVSSLKPLNLQAHHSWQSEHQVLEKGDRKLKQRIRWLRVLQRCIAMLISIAALVPISMTLHKFLTTKDIYRTAPTPTGGTINRTAWALKTKTWPTYVYFSTAALSTMINLSVLIGYCCSIRTSNILDTISTWVSSIELVGQLILWIVVAAIYKYEKEATEAGKHNDLWGWSCSTGADVIQEAFNDVVSFDQYCTIQAASWYAGLAQVGAIILSLVIMALAWRRKKSKANVRRSAQRGVEGLENYRHQHF